MTVPASVEVAQRRHWDVQFANALFQPPVEAAAYVFLGIMGLGGLARGARRRALRRHHGPLGLLRHADPGPGGPDQARVVSPVVTPALAIAATGVPAVDRAVAAAARRRRVLVNAVDRPAEYDFILPPILRRGALQIAVSTGGRSPALARDIRRKLECLFPDEHGTFVERVGRPRTL